MYPDHCKLNAVTGINCDLPITNIRLLTLINQCMTAKSTIDAPKSPNTIQLSH